LDHYDKAKAKERDPIDDHANLSKWLTTGGQIVSRYGLVVVLAWIGFGKYAKMEARVLIEHSPLMSWICDVLSVGGVAKALGTTEIIAAILIALRPFGRRYPRSVARWR
jgi:uncharacterized membrane protein YkgB